MAWNTCKICANSQDNTIYMVRGIEEFPGLNNEFEYLECSECGCVQIVNVPQDLSKYYSFNYYSFQKNDVKEYKGFLKFLKRKRAQHCLGSKNLLGGILSKT